MKTRTREEMLASLLNCVEDWELDTLIDHVKNNLADYYENCSDEELEEAYDAYVVEDEE
jgi:DNA-binding protein Fis